MRPRRIGRSELMIAPLVLGTNVFGWNVDEPAAFAILDAFVDAGFNAIDTADSYSRWVKGHPGGESETIIGNWIRRSGKRGKVVIGTKFGEDMGEGRSIAKDYIIRSVEGSLKRLQTDVVDLYQTHFDDDVTPPEETMAAFDLLIRQGKVRAAGLSNLTPERMIASLETSRRLGFARYECLQPLYNLSDRREFESEYAPICAREQIGVIPYYSLAAGFLTGKYRSADEAGKNPARGGRLKRYLDGRGLCILGAIDTVARRHNATCAQVALAWMMAKPLITAPIVSATSLAQLADIMQAPRLTLTADDMTLLDGAAS